MTHTFNEFKKLILPKKKRPFKVYNCQTLNKPQFWDTARLCCWDEVYIEIIFAAISSTNRPLYTTTSFTDPPLAIWCSRDGGPTKYGRPLEYQTARGESVKDMSLCDCITLLGGPKHVLCQGPQLSGMYSNITCQTTVVSDMAGGQWPVLRHALDSEGSQGVRCQVGEDWPGQESQCWRVLTASGPQRHAALRQEGEHRWNQDGGEFSTILLV